MTDAPKIPHVAWRNGKPRFAPSPTLRAMGYESKDLRHENGRWFTAGEALDWSRTLAANLERARRESRKRARSRPAPAILEKPKVAPVLPLRQLFEDFLDERKHPGIADRAAKTRLDYRQKANIFRNHAPEVWQSEVEALTKPICIGLYEDLRMRVGLPSAVGAMRVLGIALQWAIDRGRLPLMPVNPAHKLKMKVPPPRLRVGTIDEMKAMIAAADAIGLPWMGDCFVLAIWTGQRQADRLQLTTHARVPGRLIFRQEKTRAIVSIPEAPLVKERLKAAAERRKLAEVVSPFVVLNEEKWQPVTPAVYRARYESVRRLAAKTHPSLKDFRDQDFRDTAVTWLANSTATLPEICAITGHSLVSAHQVMKHYLALNPELATSAIAKMVEWYEGETTTNTDESNN
ncbi:tyrosine-type recombinase/integrase [Rhizobium sp. PAMB 3182]